MIVDHLDQKIELYLIFHICANLTQSSLAI